jgi:hypothetical protein
MPTTTNYGWTTPTIDGSTGTWDTILNALFTEADADLKAVEDKADDALAENLSFGIMDATVAGIVDGTAVRQGPGAGVEVQATGISAVVYFPLAVPVGMQFTGFKSRGIAPAGTALSVTLFYVDTAGTVNTVSSHSHSAALATVTKTGLAHTVVADRQYYLRASLTTTSGTDANIVWVQPTVVRI